MRVPHPACAGSDYYVKPSTESECPPGDLPCKTLDEYANDTQSQDFKDDDIKILFLSGVHYWTLNLSLSHIKTIQMTPVPDAGGELVMIQLMCSVSVTLDLVSSLILKNLTIRAAKSEKYSLMFNNLQAASDQRVQLVRINLLESSFILMIDAKNIASTLVTFTIQDSIFEKSSTTGLRISDKRLRGNFSLTVVNSSISYHQHGGVIIDSSTYLNVSIRDSTIEGNMIQITGHSSRNEYSTVDDAAAGLSVHSTRYHTANICIQNTPFVNNQDLRGKPVIVYVTKANTVIITDCEFRDNHGSAIRAVNTASLRLSGDVSFRNNSAQQGGALALISTKVLFMQGAHVMFQDNYASDVGGAIFIDSTLTLYDENSPDTHTDCFYQFPSWDPTVDYNITFANNTAQNGGHHIYGASLKSYCIVCASSSDLIRSFEPRVQRLFHFSEDKRLLASPISSNPSRVCVIDKAALIQPFNDSCADQSLIFKTRHAFPGEEFNLEAVLTGAEFGTGTGAVYAQFLSHTDALLSHDQYSQRVGQPYTPQQLNYSVYSNNSYEVLVLAATDGTILAYGNEYEISEAIETYNKTGIIPVILLTTPVYINVTLSKCPPGFYLESKSMRCTCNPKLCNNQVIGKVSNGRGLIYLRESIWVKAYNNGDVSGIIMHHNCPFDYCNKSSYTVGINLADPDTQCAMNHAGVLCGKCAPGFSLAIGSNKCLPCLNSSKVALVIFFMVAGVLLVFFIKILNMTVSQGTINGLIFYANITWAYQGIFLSHTDHEDTSIEKGSFLKTFIAWLNLDLGIETCFVQDLSAYTKTWLQFLFPFYIWCIAGGIILLARCSERLTKLFGNNSVQVLATLFLLSYAKLLRTIIIALVPATLYVYTETGEPVESLTQTVWAFDGNLLYGRVPHVFLVIVALLVLLFLWLPYTFILLFIQPLRSGSNYRCLKWVNKWKPFFDAYTGPLNSANHFWIGLLLLARFILLLTFTLTYASSPSTSVLTLNMTVIFLLTVLSCTDQLYDIPAKFNLRFFTGKVSFRSILEVSYLLNIGAIGGIILYLDSITNNTNAKMTVIYTSMIIAFLEFIGIVIYHFWCAVKACRKSIILSNVCRCLSIDHSDDSIIVPTSSTVDVGTHTQCTDNEPLSTGNQDHCSSSDYQRLLSNFTE